MFVSICSRCSGPSPYLEKNKTALCISEMGGAITVLVIGILFNLEGVGGFQLSGCIVMGIGGAWIVGNLILFAIQSTSSPSLLKKKQKFRFQRKTEARKVTAPQKKRKKTAQARLRMRSPLQSSSVEEPGPKGDRDSSTGRDFAAKLQGSPNHEAVPLTRSLPQRVEEYPGEMLTVHIKNVMASIEEIMTSKVKAEHASRVKAKLLADFDRVRHLHTTNQKKYALTVILNFGLVNALNPYFDTPSTYPIVRIAERSNFQMALHVLVHSRLGDYFLYRQIEKDPISKEASLQNCVRALVETMRRGEVPSGQELTRLAALKEALIVNTNPMDAPFWLLQQFGIKLILYSRKELEEGRLYQSIAYADEAFLPWNTLVSANRDRAKVIVHDGNDSYKSIEDAVVLQLEDRSAQQLSKTLVSSHGNIYVPISNMTDTLASFH